MWVEQVRRVKRKVGGGGDRLARTNLRLNLLAAVSGRELGWWGEFANTVVGVRTGWQEEFGN
jgi:hypothetical protein